MDIRVMIADSLVRLTGDGSRVPKVLLEYRDRRSTSVEEALESVWRICNAARHLLDEGEGALRDVWDFRAGGLRVGVGDCVEVDGVLWRCEAAGWSLV